MKNYILYNPLAGHGKHDDKLEALRSYLDGEIVECDLTKGYDGLWDNLNPDDKIIISGGDGTLNRFVNEVNTDKLDNDVYYFASGSGNDFLHDLGKEPGCPPFKINKYIKDLPTVTVKGRKYRFINGIGYGIDGYCCEEGDRLKLKSDKPVNYTAIAIKGLLYAFKPVNAKIEVDGKKYEFKKVWIAPTMNGRCYGGGMIPTPSQDRLDNEELSLMVLHGSGKLKTLMVFPSIFKGEHIAHTEMVSVLKGKRISVEFDRPCALQIDGETILEVSSYLAEAKKI